MTVHENFISENDELDFMQEIEPYMKRLRYEFDHWDDVIYKLYGCEFKQVIK